MSRRSFWRVVNHSSMLSVLVVAGCLPSAKAEVAVSDLASTFPTIERLGVKAYMVDPRTAKSDCVFFDYARGAFTSDATDEFCRVVRAPDPESATPVAFDQDASDDLAALLAEFARVDVPIEYLYINTDSSGAIGPESNFSADRCVAYFYSPGWSALPEDDMDSVSVAIDADWYKVDSCP